MYDAMGCQKIKEEPLEVLDTAIKNVMVLEVRRGESAGTYQVTIEVRNERLSLAIRWIVDCAREASGIRTVWRQILAGSTGNSIEAQEMQDSRGQQDLRTPVGAPLSFARKSMHRGKYAT